MIIPYTTRVDFGELVNQGSFLSEYKPNNVILKWTRVTRSGAKIGVYTEPISQYNSIRCSHTPENEEWHCQNPSLNSRYPTSPARPYFELHCELTSEQKR